MTPEERIEFLRRRQSGIGGSDAPNLVGVGYRTALDVYRSKVEEVDGRVPTQGVLARGIALEDTVARMYECAVYGVETAKPLAPVHHPDRPWQFANLDRVRDDKRPVQLKTVAGFGEEWGESGTDLVPRGYAIQCNQEMGCSGFDWMDLGALDVIAWEFRLYRINFDPGTFDWLTAIESRFWHEHVLPRIPPPAGWEKQFTDEALERFESGKVVALSDEIGDWCDRRKQLGDIAKEAEEEKKRLTAQIAEAMGDAESATAGSWKIKRIHIAACDVSFTRDPHVRVDFRPITKGRKL